MEQEVLQLIWKIVILMRSLCTHIFKAIYPFNMNILHLTQINNLI